MPGRKQDCSRWKRSGVAKSRGIHSPTVISYKVLWPKWMFFCAIISIVFKENKKWAPDRMGVCRHGSGIPFSPRTFAGANYLLWRRCSMEERGLQSALIKSWISLGQWLDGSIYVEIMPSLSAGVFKPGLWPGRFRIHDILIPCGFGGGLLLIAHF